MWVVWQCKRVSVWELKNGAQRRPMGLSTWEVMTSHCYRPGDYIKTHDNYNTSDSEYSEMSQSIQVSAWLGKETSTFLNLLRQSDDIVANQLRHCRTLHDKTNIQQHITYRFQHSLQCIKRVWRGIVHCRPCWNVGFYICHGRDQRYQSSCSSG